MVSKIFYWLWLLILIGLTSCAPTETLPVSTATTTSTPATVIAPMPSPSVSPSPTDPYAELRQAMVEEQLRGRDITDKAVLAAMLKVPRHEFVTSDFLSEAYNDYPLPIGHGQTISQPYIVALMSELIDLQPGEKVLEIGTGSGYQAAILAELTGSVYTIEIIPALAQHAQETLERLGYDQIEAKQSDGYWGWEEHAPFDAIIVTAAPDHVPQPLVKQLADGGKMVVPIGPPGGYQSLWVFERKGDEFLRYNWGGVRFVPLTRSE